MPLASTTSRTKRPRSPTIGAGWVTLPEWSGGFAAEHQGALAELVEPVEEGMAEREQVVIVVW